MPQYKHILTDFKDLRKVIGEVTKSQPAKTRYQQQAEKMGYSEAEAKPKDDKGDRGIARTLGKKHAGEDDIKKAYMKLGRSAQGSVEHQRQLVQKQLAKMGFKTYSKFAFDNLFKFESNQMIAKWLINEEVLLESVLSDMQSIVKNKQAKKIGGVMVDMFTASVITKAYDQVNDANKKKMEKANLQTLVKVAHKLMGMKEELGLDESKIGDLLIDIQMGATAKELARDHDISIASAKNFLSDYYGNKRTRKAPGLKKEEAPKVQSNKKFKDVDKLYTVLLKRYEEVISEGGMKRLFQDLEDGASAQQISKKYGLDMKTAKRFVDDYKKVSQAPRLRAAENDPMKEENLQEFRMKLKDIMRKHGRELKKVARSNSLELSRKAEDDLMAWAMNSGEIRTDDPDEFDQWLDNNIDDLVKGKIKEENIQEKPSILQKDIKGSKTITDIEIRFDDEKEWKRMSAFVKRELEKPAYKGIKSKDVYYSPDPLQIGFGDPKGKSKINIKPIVDLIVRNTNDPRTRLKSMAEGKSREDKLKEQKEHAQQSPFKLKSQVYPRAIAINTDGFGHRHATVEDIISACDSFGMIIDRELQVEQIQKQLGKKGFISYKKSELEDVFEDRETQRMILALESVVEEQEPIEYTKGEIEYAELHEQEIEFLKPDGTKSVGPILKMSGKTYNVKDKFTGKSFTYKYSNKLEEDKVNYENSWTKPGQGLKSYAELTEGKFPSALINKAIKITKDKKYYHGDYDGAVDAIEKLKKGLSDDPKVAKALAKAAGFESVDEWIARDGTRRRVKERDQRKYKKLKEWEEAAEASGDKAAYQKFFNAAMKKFGITSPSELSGDKEKEFYDYIDKNWKADDEEVDIHKSYKVDGRRKNFREKMRKLGYVKKQF